MGDKKWRRTMWPWTIDEYNFVSDTKKTSESFVGKMKSLTQDLLDVQVDTATKLFDITNKYSGNVFGVFEPTYKKQVEEYRNAVHSYMKH